MGTHGAAVARKRVAIGAVVMVLVATLVVWRPFAGPAGADHQPANKIAVDGNVTEIVTPDTDHTILSGTLKTSSPTDLVIQVSLECALFTDTSVKPARQVSKAQATERVEVWVEVDPTPENAADDDGNLVVPVSSNDTGLAPTDISLDNDVPPQAAAGKVVFCHRTQGLEAALDFSDAGFLETEDFIRLYQGTREASAFNWVALNSMGLGSGVYEIEVHAQILDDFVTSGDGTASGKAAVGKRTLVVEPGKLANDATI